MLCCLGWRWPFWLGIGVLVAGNDPQPDGPVLAVTQTLGEHDLFSFDRFEELSQAPRRDVEAGGMITMPPMQFRRCQHDFTFRATVQRCEAFRVALQPLLSHKCICGSGIERVVADRHCLTLDLPKGIARPAAEDIASGSYPIVRPINAVVVGRPILATRAVTEFLTGPAGQALVKRSGALGLEAVPKAPADPFFESLTK